VRSDLAKHIVELNQLLDIVIEHSCALLVAVLITPEGELRSLPAV
jgi:hypothetical protein